LSKISDDEWVLQETLYRIGETVEENSKLLQFGIQIANKLIQESSNNDNTSWTVSHANLILDRLLLQRYLERLEAFEVIQKQQTSNLRSRVTDSVMLEDQEAIPFDIEKWKEFRESNILSVAFQFAFQNQFQLLKVIFQFENVILVNHF
jgi:hypothetical protein